MSEKGISIHKFQDGNEAVVVEFGFGKIGIGLDKKKQFQSCSSSPGIEQGKRSRGILDAGRARKQLQGTCKFY